MERKCGVLLPVSSLPSKYGIGSISKEAYEFIDFLSRAGQRYWQVLPLGKTGYGDSPYQSFSTFAGNPYFIDLDALVRDGFLTREEVAACDFGNDPGKVSYDRLYEERFPLLMKAYLNSPYCVSPSGKWKDASYSPERERFSLYIEENKSWLPDYALYEAAKTHFHGAAFMEWDDDIRLRRKEALARYAKLLKEQVRYNEFLQFMFDRQWTALKTYAEGKGIRIIGDIPIYVALDSADTWSHPELFDLDEKGFPTLIAGVPPDAFSPTGQLWGNPLYNWEKHKETGYDWWIRRIRMCFHRFNVLRIDHFRGFDEYFAIPYGAQTAEGGKWLPGPGMDLFNVMKEKIGNQSILAEDLGYLTPSSRKLLKDSGYPGMKVLQFAFNPDGDSEYLPHHHVKNCIVYTGTHDNDTTRSWYDHLSDEERKFIDAYLDINNAAMAVKKMIRAALMSVADVAVIPMQDYLGLGGEARINFPSTMGENWKWRLLPGMLTQDLADWMHLLAHTYRRI